MKRFKTSGFLLTLVLAVSLGCSSTDGGTTGKRSGSPLDLASLLSGTWKAEGSDLRLEISSTGSLLTDGTYNLFAAAKGQIGGRTVNERAVISLEPGGGDVQVSMVPRFDLAATHLSDDVTKASEAELNAACNFALVSNPAGYSGQTLGGEACVRAVQGAVGRWNIEVTRDTLQISMSADQELVFRRVV
jgi:hypothetical protein